MEYIVRIQSEAYDDVEGVESETKAREIVSMCHEDICTVYSREEILDMARVEIPDLEIGYSPCGASDEEFAVSLMWHDAPNFLKDALEELGFELLFSDEYTVGSKGNIYNLFPQYMGDISPVVYPPNSGELYTPDDDPAEVIEACVIRDSWLVENREILPPWISSSEIVEQGFQKLHDFENQITKADEEEFEQLIELGTELVFHYPGPLANRLSVWERKPESAHV